MITRQGDGGNEMLGIGNYVVCVVRATTGFFGRIDGTNSIRVRYSSGGFAMNLSIDMTPEMERLLISQAAKHGKDLQTYLSDAIRSQIITPLLAAEIHDRGRGPEIKGTRITVYDVLDYQRLGWRTDAIASHLRLTPRASGESF
jgi:hypothetical protein